MLRVGCVCFVLVCEPACVVVMCLWMWFVFPLWCCTVCLVAFWVVFVRVCFCNNYVDACVCVLLVVHRMLLYGLFVCDVCLCVCVNCVCVMCL